LGEQVPIVPNAVVGVQGNFVSHAVTGIHSFINIIDGFVDSYTMIDNGVRKKSMTEKKFLFDPFLKRYIKECEKSETLTDG
jgi:hypothetical protein